MTRAERRRAEKAANKKPATYNLTIDQVNAMARETIKEDLKQAKKEAMEIADEATENVANSITALLFGLPLIILRQYYWKKAPDKKFIEFAEHLTEYYQAWQDGKLTEEQIRQQTLEMSGVAFEESE